MRLFFCLALILLSLSCVTRIAHAQVNRCIGVRGEPVFSDQPCGTPEPAVGTQRGAMNDLVNAGDDGSGYLSAACPASPQALRDRIAGAFSNDNPNLLAGLFDWRGFDHDSANARLREFRRWLRRPLIGVDFAGAADPSGAEPGDADYAPHHSDGVTVLTQSDNRADEDAIPDARSFGIAQRGGCWWLTF